MSLATWSILLASIALGWQVLTWATLRRTRLRVAPVIYYWLPTDEEAAAGKVGGWKVGVRVTNLSDHQVQVRSLSLRVQGEGVEVQTLGDSRVVNVLIPARMASHRPFVSDYTEHHANRRPTAYAERGDGAWVESWTGWLLESPAPPQLIPAMLPAARYPAPRRLRRWWLTARAAPRRAWRWIRA